MWLASGSNRYGACASLLELSYHSGMSLEFRQYPKVAGAGGVRSIWQLVQRPRPSVRFLDSGTQVPQRRVRINLEYRLFSTT
jgi:hypothetical protein